ncbi:MAG: hypothetical protein QMD07_06195 [Thermodesulfovibrionales bacterium]|nr:hypothetical protein [Thermodesulfovibrionales bacterium]
MIRWLAIAALTAFMSGNSHAETKKEAQEKGITPYGVSCPLCGQYGYCKKEAKYEEAVRALEKYYKEKGMTVVITKKEGRFIEADVYKDKDLADRVVLDCKTGKIRSIY